MYNTLNVNVLISFMGASNVASMRFMILFCVLRELLLIVIQRRTSQK
jgi:hypothetical protein